MPADDVHESVSAAAFARPERPLRVAIVQRVCMHYRVPMYARLARVPGLRLRVFHGASVPGTQLANARDFQDLDHVELFTLRRRGSPWVFHPGLLRALWRFRPDVLLIEGGSNVLSNFLVYVYAGAARVPVIWWTLGELLGAAPPKGLRRLPRALVRWMERRADVWLGYSSVALEHFEKQGYPRERCFRAVNCVDTERVENEIERCRPLVPRLRTTLDLTDHAVILFVGALTAGKKIHRLLHAFARVHERLPQTRLLIVGDGADRARLEALARELGIASITVFTGQVIEDVAAYYQVADLFVLPGLGGLVVSEALTHGVPVICTFGDGCEVDYIRDGISGYRLVSDEDEQVVAYLADKMMAVLGDPQRLAQMRHEARRVIAEEHNVQSYIANLVAAIRKAADRRRDGYALAAQAGRGG